MRRVWRFGFGGAMGALFVALMSCIDLTHYVEMRERVSMAWDASETWTGGGCER